MTVWLCGYREWANEIFENFPMGKIINNPDEFEQKLDLIDKKDLIFFIGWSWIVDDDIVSNYHCICMHPSRLPRYRGGSPLQHQIIAGEDVSAVSLFLMNYKIDAGKILFQEDFSLDGTLSEIFERIVEKTSMGINHIIAAYQQNHNLEGVVQDSSKATYFRRRKPHMSEITLDDINTCTAKQIYDKIRALGDPYPNAYIKCADGKNLYIKEALYEE